MESRPLIGYADRMDDIEFIIVAAIERLWEAGYEIRPRPEMIPILLNPPGHAD